MAGHQHNSHGTHARKEANEVLRASSPAGKGEHESRLSHAGHLYGLENLMRKTREGYSVFAYFVPSRTRHQSMLIAA